MFDIQEDVTEVVARVIVVYLFKSGQGGQKVGWFYSKKLLLDKK